VGRRSDASRFQNKVNDRERIELMKYDPKARKHVLFKEEK